MHHKLTRRTTNHTPDQVWTGITPDT